MAEGPRDVLVGRNSATTKHPSSIKYNRINSLAFLRILFFCQK